jgi:two-component system LytT family response regulator
VRQLLAQLDPAVFARIHRSAIVNLSSITALRSLSSGDAVVTLKSGIRLRVSRSYRRTLDARLAR